MATTALITTDPAAPAFSALCLTLSETTVLAKAFDHTATFTAAEIALVEPIASALAVAQPADERTIRQSIGALASALPSQDRGEVGGKLQLATYRTALAGCDHRALAYACRRCLDELDWLPTVHQLKERMDRWVSPEAAAIASARMIMRAGRRAPAEDRDAEQVGAIEVEALCARLASATGPTRSRPEAVAWDSGSPLQPHQIRVPNKEDYQRLFGIDPETVRANAEAALAAEREADQDLLVDAQNLWQRLYAVPERAAA